VKKLIKYFTAESVHLLSSLQKNNNGQWYQQNKKRLDEYLIAPARHMVGQVGDILSKYAEGLVIDPRVDRCVYRLRRDTRFSQDKKPLKEHLGLIWWRDYPEGKMGSPCFYFQLMPEGFLWSVGCYAFTPETLEAFRLSLLDSEHGRTFRLIVSGARRRELVFNPPALKRLPHGFSGPDWAEEWLKRKGLYTWSQLLPNADNTILGPQGGQYLAKRFLEALPIYLWLVKLFERVKGRGAEKSEAHIVSQLAPAATVKLYDDEFWAGAGRDRQALRRRILGGRRPRQSSFTTSNSGRAPGSPSRPRPSRRTLWASGAPHWPGLATELARFALLAKMALIYDFSRPTWHK
jgi:uncharacterized protein (TIGR02453 family)